MDKEEILERLADLQKSFDVDGDLIDFAYWAEEEITNILEECEN